MGEKPDKRISRRSLLFRFREILADSVSAAAEDVGRAARVARTDAKKPSAQTPFPMPQGGVHLDEIPVVHPWIALAYALGDHLGRRYPYSLLLGASGEAFRFSYDREDPVAAHRNCPINGFLAALAVCGLNATAAHGGPFDPALGGIEVAAARGQIAVVATRSGPGVVHAVDRQSEEVTWHPSMGIPAKVSFSEFAKAWEGGYWSAGPAPFLRILVSASGRPRSLDDVSRVGLESLEMLLSRSETFTPLCGLAAYDALAEDLASGALGPGSAAALAGLPLTTFGVGRIAAWRFLEAVARATPPEHQETIEAAALLYREIHNPDPAGGTWGTGFFPELMECLTEGGRPDPERLESPGVRERAALLVRSIRENEAQALAQIRQLPRSLRALC